MSIIEGQQQEIPQEEATKREKDVPIIHMAEEEQRTQDNKEPLEQRLDLLRSNISLEGISFLNEGALEEFLSKKDFLEQMVTLEKAAEVKAVSPQQMINLFKTTRSNNIRLAAMENLSGLKFDNLQERNEMLFLLKETAIGRSEQAKIMPLKLSDLERMYVSKYRLDWDEDEDFDMMTTAAIEALSKFGKDAEDSLMEVLKVNLEKGKPKDIKEIVGAENYVSYGDDGSLDPFFDERGFAADDEAKLMFDTMYLYNALILRKLVELGSKKGIEFLNESVPDKDAFNVIYYRESVDLLASMLKEVKAAGKKIDYETKVDCLSRQ